MRVLCLSKSTGGLAVYNRRLCTGLQALGHDVQVIALSEGADEYAAALSRDGIEADAWPMARYRISPLADLRLARRLARRVRRTSPAVVLGHGAKSGFLARLAGRLTRTPAVYAMHSQPYLRRVQGSAARAYALLERAASSWLGGHTVVLSEHMKASVLAHRIAAPNAVSVIRTGIAPPESALPERDDARHSLGLARDGLLVAWAGRFSRQKAPERFVELAAKLAAGHPGATFALFGDGEQGPGLARLIDERGLAGRVVLLPWQRDPTLIYAACDVFVLTSRWEGLPLVLLEAMAAQRAIVAPAVDAIPEALSDRVDGLLCPPDSVAALADAVDELLREPELRLRLGEAAAARVREEFSAHRMVQQWEDLLRGVAAAR